MYLVLFYENYEIVLKWFVVLSFFFASAAAIRRASEDAFEMDVFGVLVLILIIMKGMYEE